MDILGRIMAFFVLGGFLLLTTIGLIKVATTPQAVCHAVTEDSVITDCEYRNGAWYRK